MSNHLAVAAATQTLARLLDEQLTRDFAGAHAVPGRPDGAITDDSDPEVRIFLYRVEPSASWRTTALPSRTSTGQTCERPQIGLTLHYLLSCLGSESRLEPQRMLGSVVRTLAARPLLTRAAIDAMVQAALAQDPQHPLGNADLSQQPELVRLSPLPLSLDELSTVWSSFFQTPYRLSAAYEASVVVLTADETPTRALPVRERHLFATTILRPTIRRTASVDGPLVPVLPGAVVELVGSQLRDQEITVVAFGGEEVSPAPEDTGGERIEVTVPATVRAGVNGVRVVHFRLMGEPPQPRLAAQSNVVPLVVSPQLQPLAANAVHDVAADPDTGLRSGAIGVSVEPPVGNRQHVTLLLNAVPGGTGESYVFEDERRDAEGEPEETTDLDLPFAGVAAGDYLLRVAVDGAETVLEVGTVSGSASEGQYVGPVVTVP